MWRLRCSSRTATKRETRREVRFFCFFGAEVENCPRKCRKLSSDNRNGASEDSDESDSWPTWSSGCRLRDQVQEKISEASREYSGYFSYLAGEDYVPFSFVCFLLSGGVERFKDALVASNAAAAADASWLWESRRVGREILRAGLWVFIYNL